jgi:hypothetical protein
VSIGGCGQEYEYGYSVPTPVIGLNPLRRHGHKLYGAVRQQQIKVQVVHWTLRTVPAFECKRARSIGRMIKPAMTIRLRMNLKCRRETRIQTQHKYHRRRSRGSLCGC